MVAFAVVVAAAVGAVAAFEAVVEPGLVAVVGFDGRGLHLPPQHRIERRPPRLKPLPLHYF